MGRQEQPLVQCSVCPRRFRGRVYSGPRFCSPACRQQAYRDRLGNARVTKPALDGAAGDAQGLGNLPVGPTIDP